MIFILILFFASLIAITSMIGWKLFKLQSGQVVRKEEIVLETPVLEEFKKTSIKKIKVLGHKSLVETIRFYFRFVNLLKNKYQEIKMKVKNIRLRDHRETEKPEISKFLKVVSEYKQKIRKIKDRVKEEESL